MPAIPRKIAKQSTLTAIIVDYAEVVSKPPSRKCAHLMAKTLGLEHESFQKLYAASRTLYDSGRTAPKEYWLRFAVDSRARITSAQVEKLRELDVQMWGTADERMTRWMACLCDAGFKTALLSNMIPDLAAHARRRFKWLEKFTCTVLSCEIGLAKPDEDIFRHCLARLHVVPTDVLFVDDRAVNVLTAREMGMTAIQFRSIGQLRDELAAIRFPILPSTS